DRDRPGLELAEERAADVPLRVERGRDGLVTDARRTVEAQVAALRRERAEELDQPLFVVPSGDAQAQRRPIPQDHILDQRLDRHGAILACRTASCTTGKYASGRSGATDAGCSARRDTRSVYRRSCAMNPIMLATDGSPSAEAATDQAIELAHA